MQTITKDEIKNLAPAEISSKIIQTEKYILELRFKHAAKQPIKTHLFKKHRRILAQLLTEYHRFQNSLTK